MRMNSKLRIHFLEIKGVILTFNNQDSHCSKFNIIKITFFKYINTSHNIRVI